MKTTAQPSLRGVIDFLMGAAPLEGVWFGGKHPTERGDLWWRERLKASACATFQAPEGGPADGVAQALERCEKAIYNIGGEHVTGMQQALEAAENAGRVLAGLHAALATQPSIQDLAAGAHYPQVSAWSNQAAPAVQAPAEGDEELRDRLAEQMQAKADNDQQRGVHMPVSYYVRSALIHAAASNVQPKGTKPDDLAEPVYIRTLCKALDAALDFAGTVAGGASWWDDVWAELDAEVERTRQAYYTQAPAPAHELLHKLRAHIVWLAFGECRSPGWEGPPPTAREAVDAIDAALAEQAPAVKAEPLIELQMRLASQVPAVAHQVPEGMALVPVKPTRGLLISMAIRSDHALGIPGYYDEMREHLPADHPMKSVTHAQRMQSTMNSMRQLHEEVVGTGFYKPEREASYAASFDVPVQGTGGGNAG